MKRYAGNIDYILNLDIDRGIEMLSIAYQKKNEEVLFDRWKLEHLFQDKPQNFDEYKKQFIATDNNFENNDNKNESKEERIKKAYELADDIISFDTKRQKGGNK